MINIFILTEDHMAVCTYCVKAISYQLTLQLPSARRSALASFSPLFWFYSNFTVLVQSLISVVF